MKKISHIFLLELHSKSHSRKCLVKYDLINKISQKISKKSLSFIYFTITLIKKSLHLFKSKDKN